MVMKASISEAMNFLGSCSISLGAVSSEKITKCDDVVSLSDWSQCSLLHDCILQVAYLKNIP